MNIAIAPTNRMPRVQCENNAPLPPTMVAQSGNDCWRASDFVEYEQQMVKQRLEAKQEKLYHFKQSIKTRVRENEAAKRRGILDKENAVENSIRSRTKQYSLATGNRPPSADRKIDQQKMAPIPTTPIVGRRGRKVIDDVNEIEVDQQAEVQIVEVIDGGIANLEIQEAVHYQVKRDVVDPTRLYAGVRAAAMSDERERVRRSVQYKRDLQHRMQLEAQERERREIEAREREERLRREEEERLFLQEQEEKRIRAIADAERRAELRAKAKEAETCRYAEALHQQFKERIANKNVEIVPLCPCSSRPLDHNPSFCFLNCVYYNNPQAYRAALNNLLEELEIEPVSV